MPCQIINANSELHLPDLSEEFDACITDPYFDVMSIGNSKATKQDRNDRFIPICKEIYRVLKPDSSFVFFCSVKYMMQHSAELEAIGFTFCYEMIWNKNRGVSFLTAKKRPLQKHETIFVYSKGKPNYNYEEAKSHGHKPTKRGRYKIDKDYVKIETNHHENDGSRYMTTVLDCPVSTYKKRTTCPFEKPIPLCERLVQAFSNPGDTILDPYSGSGSICLAARNLDRKFLGIEINEDYWRQSIESLRCNDVLKGPS